MFGSRERCPGCGRRADRNASWCSGCGRRLGDQLLVIEPTGKPESATVVHVGSESTSDAGRNRRRRDAAIIGALVIGLIAALATLGSGPNDGERADAGSTTTETTRRRPSTTASPAGQTSTSSTLPSPVLGAPSGISLVLTSNTGAMSVLDLDRGTATPISGRADGTVFAREHGIAYSAGAAVLYRPAPFDAQPVELARPGRAIPADERDRLWVFTDTRPTQVRQVDLAGNETVAPFTLEDPNSLVAGVRGGLVLATGGRIYLWDEHIRSVRPLRYGQVRATGAGLLLRYSCDDSMECGYWLTNLRTGQDRPVKALTDSESVPAWPDLRPAFSPDGSTLALMPIRPGVSAVSMALIDVATLELTWVSIETPAEIDPSSWSRPPAWSASSEWLFWCDGYLNAYRLGTEGPMRFEAPDSRCTSVVPL